VLLGFANKLVRCTGQNVSRTLFVDDFNIIRYLIGRNDKPIHGVTDS